MLTAEEKAPSYRVARVTRPVERIGAVIVAMSREGLPAAEAETRLGKAGLSAAEAKTLVKSAALNLKVPT